MLRRASISKKTIDKFQASIPYLVHLSPVYTMSASSDHDGTLPDGLRSLLERGPGSSDAVATLKRLLDELTTTPHTSSVEEALQLLGTAVGKQSRQYQLLQRPN